MTDRLAALAAAVMLAVTLAACGAADDKANGAAPDTTPNGSITTQPDTNGTDTGSAKDDLNGGHNESGRADEDGQMDGTAETRRYDRALAASLSQLILNRIGERQKRGGHRVPAARFLTAGLAFFKKWDII